MISGGRMPRRRQKCTKTIFYCGLLLLRKNRVFHAFAYAELERGLGRNLNGFARRRVSAFASFSLRAYELAEAGQSKLSVGFDFVAREVGEFFKKFLNLCALQAKLFR